MFDILKKEQIEADERFKRWWILSGFDKKLEKLPTRDAISKILDEIEMVDENIQKGIKKDSIALRYRVMFWVLGYPVLILAKIVSVLTVSAIYVYRARRTPIYLKKQDEKKFSTAVEDLLDESKSTLDIQNKAEATNSGLIKNLEDKIKLLEALKEQGSLIGGDDQFSDRVEEMIEYNNNQLSQLKGD